jgi:hypothetical protein
VLGDIVSDDLKTRLNVGNIIDTKENLLVRSKGSQNVGDLVTVNTIDSDNLIARELGNISLDLVSGLAGTNLVRRVDDTLGTTGEATGRARRARGTGRNSGGRRSDSGGGGNCSVGNGRGSSSTISTNNDGDSDGGNVLTLVQVVHVDGLGSSQQGRHGHRGGDKKLGVENHVGSNVDFSSVELRSGKLERVIQV